MGTTGGSDFGINDFTGQAGRGPVRPSDVAARGAANVDRDRPDWASEDEYWRNSYGSRPYARADLPYEHYQPAYRFGYESAIGLHGRRWEEVEPELKATWETEPGEKRSAWEQVKDAVRDAFHRMSGDDATAGGRERGLDDDRTEYRAR